MSVETVAEKNRAPGVIPAAPWRVSAVNVLHSGYRLAVTFVDGTNGIADLSKLVNGPNPGIYAALADPAFFDQVKLELGVITWPNGADLDPSWLHDEISAHGEWVAPE